MDWRGTPGFLGLSGFDLPLYYGSISLKQSIAFPGNTVYHLLTAGNNVSYGARWDGCGSVVWEVQSRHEALKVGGSKRNCCKGTGTPMTIPADMVRIFTATVPDNNRQSRFSPTTVPKLSTGMLYKDSRDFLGQL